MLRTTWICLAVVSLIVAGCGKKADEPKKSTAPRPPITTETGKTPDPKAPIATTPDTKPPDTKAPVTKTPDKTPDTKAPVVSGGPDQTIREITQGLAEYKPIVAWQSLPSSYQKDVKGLISEFAGKMDKDLWNKGFAVGRKAVDLLKKQKELIIDQIMANLPFPIVTKEQLSSNWDAVVNILNTIVTSEISNLDELKKANVEGWLNGTVSKLMKEIDAIAKKEVKNQDFVSTVKSVKATLVKMEGDTATVKIEAPGKPAEDKVFVKVEGKWVIKELADNWQKSMKDARDGLAQIKPEEISKNKEKVLEVMNLADKKLDELAKAKTPEEFKKVIEEIMKLAMGGGK